MELYISNNLFSGEIPDNVGNCLTLEQLYMHNNFFGGNIPQSLSNLTGIWVLDLSHNNLTGNIPLYFDNFPLLHYLNLSFNNLDGEVPMEGIFRNSSAVSAIVNSILCGGIWAFQLSVCPAKPTQRQRSFILLKVIVPVLVGVTCVIVLFSTILCNCSKQQKDFHKQFNWPGELWFCVQGNFRWRWNRSCSQGT